MNEQKTLKRYLSPLGVWALSFGCSVGWGAFVMPGTTFLPIAGPLGTALGIAIGAIIMLVIGRSYYYLMSRYPDAGGAYAYAKKLLGYDHGFLSAWFLVLTYVVIVWANLTALALIGRNLLGDMFRFGFHYQIAGYDIYFGEILGSIGVLAICGLFLILRKRLAIWVQIVMAVILIGGDEFAVLLRGRDFDNRVALAEQVTEKSRNNLEGEEPVVAIGMSDFDLKTDKSVDDVFERADAAMYKNKSELKALR